MLGAQQWGQLKNKKIFRALLAGFLRRGAPFTIGGAMRLDTHFLCAFLPLQLRALFFNFEPAGDGHALNFER